MKMEFFYKVGENIYLPCRDDNSLRIGFEPFKLEAKSPLDGIEGGSCSSGGAKLENGKPTFYCKSDENKSFNPVKSDPKKPDWVKDTEGSCQYYTKKRSDLEKHLYGKHRMKFISHCYRCTHCDYVAIDRVRAKAHKNSCESILNWAVQTNSSITIHPQFLTEYVYWTEKSWLNSAETNLIL